MQPRRNVPSAELSAPRPSRERAHVDSAQEKATQKRPHEQAFVDKHSRDRYSSSARRRDHRDFHSEGNQHRTSSALSPRPHKRYREGSSAASQQKFSSNLRISATNVQIRVLNLPSGEEQIVNTEQYNKILQGKEKQNSTELELSRKQALQRVRKEYVRILQEVGLPPPKLSINRWLIERYLRVKNLNSDPLLPCLCEPEVSPSLFREIIEDIPKKVHMFPRDVRQARNSLQLYCNAAIELAQDNSKHSGNILARELSQEEQQNIIKQCNTAMEWADKQYDMEKILQKLKEVKIQIGKELQDKMEPVVADVCVRLAKYCDEQNEQLQSHYDEAVTHNHEIKIASDARGRLLVEFGDVALPLQPSYLEKLKELYKMSTNNRNSDSSNTRSSEDNNLENSSREFNETDFRLKVGCLLLRYHSFAGLEGTSLQSALPPTVFELLHREMGVEFECFASPLNCYFPQYCSAFADTDCYFGSCGSFFNFYPVSGSFEVNPPFTEELLVEMANHIEQLLTSSSGPMSFIVFVSDWMDSPGVIAMNESRYLRREFVLEPRRHHYLSGSQHEEELDSASFAAVHATHVFVLQNDQGHAKWKPTDALVNAIRQCY